MIRFGFVVVFLLISLSTFSQKISAIEFISLSQKVKEKYGTFTTTDKVLKSYKVENPTLGKNQIVGEKNTLDYELIIDDNSFTNSIRCFTNDTSIHRIRITFEVDSNERFYGGGEQFSHFLLNGKRLPIITEENGIGRGDKPISKFTKMLGIVGSAESSYYPLPYFVSSKHYAMGLSGAATQFLATLDFSENGKVIFDVEEPFVSIQVTKANSYSELFTRSNFSTANRAFEYPEWSYGTILGLQGGTQKVEAILDSCLRIGNPVKAVWIQDWCGRRKTRLGSQLKWEWKPDTTLYPDFKNWTRSLNLRGIKVLGYVNPFLSLNTPMYREADSLGFLIKNKKGQTHIVPTGGFDAAMVNLIDINAQNWLRNIIEKNLIGNGLSGWMADFGEWCPLFVKDSIFNSFASSESWESQYSVHYKGHNAYVARWADVNANAVANHPDEELLFFMRAGSALSNLQCPMHWMGDQMVSWGENDGIKSTVTALNSAAMSGVQHLHSDIGGYTTVKNIFVKETRSQELLFRWAELNVFQPFYRTHEGVKPEANHQFYSEDSTMRFFAKMSKLHYALKDYRKQYESRANAFPLLRPLLLDYPNDSNCFDLKYQFMYGHEMMVAPVLDKGATSQKVYLPKGEWVHLFSKKKYSGNQTIEVDAPFGQPPVFIKSQSSWLEYFSWLTDSFLK
jgi:alpha-glucosidase